MIEQKRILYTGGTGLLGKELQQLMPDAFFPSHTEFDVTDYSQMLEFLQKKEIQVLIHGAAYTSPPRVDKDPMGALETNIIGTANIVKLCFLYGIRLVYLSTDYVFNGEQGNYSEEDSVFPVNKYAWSKLGGECAVRMYDNSLIIRTSFGAIPFPYPKAFVDQFTSRESVKIFAKKLVEILKSDLTGTLHVGGSRQTTYEYAKSLNPHQSIEGLRTTDVNFRIPKDTSLNCKKYNNIFGDKK